MSLPLRLTYSNEETTELESLQQKIRLLTKEKDALQASLTDCLEAMTMSTEKITQLQNEVHQLHMNDAKKCNDVRLVVDHLKSQLEAKDQLLKASGSVRMSDNSVQLQNTIEQLKQKLSNCQKEFNIEKENHLEAKNKLGDMIRKFHTVTEENLRMKNQIETEKATSMKNVEASKEREKNSEEEIKKLTKQLDELSVFKHQAEVYEHDFKLERKSREELNDEKLELERQLESLKRHQDVPHNIPGEPPANDPPATPQEDFSCPFCQQKLDDFDSLSLHINDSHPEN